MADLSTPKMDNIQTILRARAAHLCGPGITTMSWTEVAVLFTRAADEIEYLKNTIDRMMRNAAGTPR